MRLALATLAACLAASASLAETPRAPRSEIMGPECLTAATAFQNATAHGAVAGRLDGAEATALLRKINATGEPTDYRADTLVIVLRPDRAIIGLFHACHENDVVMRLDVFAEVWRAVRGEGV